VLAAAALCATPGVARDQVQITGSSTVLPYAQIVAETFGENFDFPAPVVEGGGSGAGRQKLCQGLGPNTVDIANSSSRITQRDLDTCAANGVAEVMEVRFGYDGIVFASDVDGPAFDFTPADIYTALAARVNLDGRLVANPFTRYSQVNPDLPDREVLMFVPGTKHGTREVFDIEVIEAGCKQTGAHALFLAAAEAAAAQPADDREAARKARRACNQLRTDGRAVDIDGDYTETLARLEANPDAVGVFGLSFYQNNTHRLRVATMSGVTPSAQTITSGAYPVARPLYFYVKRAHVGVIPGLHDFVAFFLSDEIAGPDGLLAEYGLIADPELAVMQTRVRDRVPMGRLE
jgi:phosphate transport system substrate-binding protein